ncbi:glutamyl-tRNA synthetase [Diaporthe sp. PMI_573]|nr:glutamyl-tRNA synthetase [Diaporthaceae sp. PMI_573]
MLCLDDTEFRKTKKLTWLASEGTSLIEVELWHFDHLLTKDTLVKDDELDDYLATDSAQRIDVLCDDDVARLTTGDIIQLERKGFYPVDEAVGKGPGGRAVLFRIPTASKD